MKIDCMYTLYEYIAGNIRKLYLNVRYTIKKNSLFIEVTTVTYTSNLKNETYFKQNLKRLGIPNIATKKQTCL